MDMAKRGFAFVNFNYRLAPKWKFPTPLHDTNAVLNWVCANARRYHLDPARIIDSTSGWFRGKCTDVESLHIYFGPWTKVKKTKKPLVLSEFGGYAYPVEGHIFNPDKAYGYKSCKSLEDFQADVETLYRTRILPKVKEGLCAAIYTQVSDVEDEINGFLTYDRKVCKADTEAMQKLADALQNAVGQMEAP
jgi:hypothetical protein